MVALKLAVQPKPPPPLSIDRMATELGLSTSETHAAIKRLARSPLLTLARPTIGSPEVRPIGRPPVRPLINRPGLIEFVRHGLRYVFIPERGPVTRGMPTAHAAPPLNEYIAVGEAPPVWPDPKGKVRGETFSPLYPSAVVAAKADHNLYMALALVDAIRGGSARERELAVKILPDLFEGKLSLGT